MALKIISDVCIYVLELNVYLQISGGLKDFKGFLKYLMERCNTLSINFSADFSLLGCCSASGFNDTVI